MSSPAQPDESFRARNPVSGAAPREARATPEIDRTLDQLQALLAWAGDRSSRLGYFAALYLRVTQAIAREVRAGRFDDGSRMDRLVGTFARRYHDAVAGHRAHRPVTASWAAAFDACMRSRPLVLQHLLLGMNAHINLDLGIAVVEVSGDRPLSELRADYDRINAVLASLVDSVQHSLTASAPLLWLLDQFAGRSDEMLANFSMTAAREGAWRFAEDLAQTPARERTARIAARDARVGQLGRQLAFPGPLLSGLLLPLHWLERGSPARITQSLLAG